MLNERTERAAVGVLLAVAQREFVLLRSGGRGSPQLGGRKVGCGGCQQREGTTTNVEFADTGGCYTREFDRGRNEVPCQ